jgi:hypothetical protein
MFNPRWPHTFVVFRDRLDSNGLPVTDEEGRPVEDHIHLRVVRYGADWNPQRGLDGEFAWDCQCKIPWGYRTSTGGMKDSGEVFQADFKISCPMLLTPLENGVRLRLTDYTHTFEAVVKKSTTYNWGTDLWIDQLGNNGRVSG